MRRSDALVLTAALAGRDQKLVGMNRQAFDVIGVTEIVTLRLFIDVVEHDGGSDKVDNLAGWKLVKVGATILTAISINLK